LVYLIIELLDKYETNVERGMLLDRNVLYIEDNEKIGSRVKEELEQRGFSVQWLLSGEGVAVRLNDKRFLK